MTGRDTTTTITISGSVAHGSARPVGVAWTIKLGPDDTPETLVKAIDIVCRDLKAALLGAMT